MKTSAWGLAIVLAAAAAAGTEQFVEHKTELGPIRIIQTVGTHFFSNTLVLVASDADKSKVRKLLFAFDQVESKGPKDPAYPLRVKTVEEQVAEIAAVDEVSAKEARKKYLSDLEGHFAVVYHNIDDGSGDQ